MMLLKSLDPQFSPNALLTESLPDVLASSTDLSTPAYDGWRLLTGKWDEATRRGLESLAPIVERRKGLDEALDTWCASYAAQLLLEAGLFLVPGEIRNRETSINACIRPTHADR
ncbi:MAG: hypothetical protein U1D30_26670 [Planctomycetota bacterium]